MKLLYNLSPGPQRVVGPLPRRVTRGPPNVSKIWDRILSVVVGHFLVYTAPRGHYG